MKVQELLMNIKNEEFKLERDLEVKKYLPMEAKKLIAQSVIYECTDNENGAIKVNSVQRYMSYVRYMIITHTNIEYTDEDYDVLCSTEYGYTNLLNAIIACFGDDAQECTRILNLMMDDYMQEMTIEFNAAKLLHRLSEIINGLADKAGSFDFNSMIPDNVDMNKLGTFLQNYIK